MSNPEPSFPNSVWGGLSDNPDRTDLNVKSDPTFHDYDRLRAELVAVQDYLLNGDGGSGNANIITSDQTIYVATTGDDVTGDGTVGTPYATIAKALETLDARAIAADATVTISIADGTYNTSASINVNHPNGDRIQIIGNTGSEASVLLNFNNNTSGIQCFSGNRLGLLNGVTIQGTWTGSGATGLSLSGIRASANSLIQCGDSVTVTDFYYGAQADRGGTVEADSITISNGGDAGLFAYNGGNIQANNATISNCRDTTRSLGSGVVSEINGNVRCNTINVTTCDVAGIYCIGGAVRCDTFTCDTNDGVGVRVARSGSVDCVGSCSASSNGSHGIQVEGGGMFTCFGALTADSNGADGLNCFQGFARFYTASSFDSNTGRGIYANAGSNVICAGSSTASNNTSNGIEGFADAYIAFASCTSTGNGGQGATAVLGSTIRAVSATLTGNTGADTNITVNTVSSDGSYIQT